MKDSEDSSGKSNEDCHMALTSSSQKDLMVYRGAHYCMNERFVKNFRELYCNDCP